MKIKSILKRVNIVYISKMAKSKFEYVKNFEMDDRLLPNCWLIVRIDGKAFHKFSKTHHFEKPNDIRALNLMNKAAAQVMKEFKDIVISYGQSDEYSFVLRKDTDLYNRRASKLMTYISSLFSSSYVYYWHTYFQDLKLRYPPAFDSRIVLYPTNENLKDYLSWRQADCHINNLYNTTFWNLVQKGGLTNAEAEKKLSGTLAADKNEILFSSFGINYNNELVIFKKGTILVRKKVLNPKNNKNQIIIMPLHEDLIQESFWNTNSEIINIKPVGLYTLESKIPLPELVLSQLRLDDINHESKST